MQPSTAGTATRASTCGSSPTRPQRRRTAPRSPLRRGHPHEPDRRQRRRALLRRARAATSSSPTSTPACRLTRRHPARPRSVRAPALKRRKSRLKRRKSLDSTCDGTPHRTSTGTTSVASARRSRRRTRTRCRPALAARAGQQVLEAAGRRGRRAQATGLGRQPGHPRSTRPRRPRRPHRSSTAGRRVPSGQRSPAATTATGPPRAASHQATRRRCAAAPTTVAPDPASEGDRIRSGGRHQPVDTRRRPHRRRRGLTPSRN